MFLKATAETVRGVPATPEEVAWAVCMLCSRLSAHITGQTIHFSGGRFFGR
jgi:enoyl-[acyl-carrier-protein] reductase (NADH)